MMINIKKNEKFIFIKFLKEIKNIRYINVAKIAWKQMLHTTELRRIFFLLSLLNHLTTPCEIPKLDNDVIIINEVFKSTTFEYSAGASA